jgi:uncharacterized membrane protein
MVRNPQADPAGVVDQPGLTPSMGEQMELVGGAGRRLTIAAVVAVGAGSAAAAIARRRRQRYMPVRRGGTYLTVRTVTVDRPAAVVRELWRSEPQLSSILGRAVAVETRSAGRRDYIAPECDTGAGWSAEAVIDEQGGSARWHVRGGRLAHDGRMELTEAPGDRGTEVRVELTYPGGRLRHAAATLAGRRPDQVLRTLLRRTKSVLEGGEVVSSTEQPSRRGRAAEWATRVVRERLAVGGRA